MGRIGLTEILIIGALIMILFGSKKLPAFGSALAEAIRNFKKGMNPDENKPGTDSPNKDNHKQ